MDEVMTRDLPVKKATSGAELPWRGYALADVLPTLQAIAANDHERWNWGRNTQCKYVRVSIDTRDGGYVRLFDRDNNDITLDEFKRQHGKS